MTIRDYEENKDKAPVLELWQSALSRIWPIHKDSFQVILGRKDAMEPGEYKVLELDERIVGFIACTLSNRDAKLASLQLIIIAPEYQRAGYGRMLVQAALQNLRARNITKVQLGAGASRYFWPGVPTNLPGASNFFEACEFGYIETIYDLTINLDDYITPPDLIASAESTGITFTLATGNNRNKILEFEEREFPSWHQYYRAAQKPQNILIAKDDKDNILGTALLDDPDSRRTGELLWQELLSGKIGTMGCLGVAEHARERGIGLAMAARATEILKARNVNTIYLGWTWLVDWYGKLGYKIWREYKMYSTDLY
jgi:ribosomal protein S18 acetylase RimI-like enzyme